jgi:hypothetical protein
MSGGYGGVGMCGVQFAGVGALASAVLVSRYDAYETDDYRQGHELGKEQAYHERAGLIQHTPSADAQDAANPSLA